VTVLRSWLGERGRLPAAPLFITRRGTPLSRDALERRIVKYTATAAKACPALLEKKVSPHTLRHSAAMRLLSAGVDTSATRASASPSRDPVGPGGEGSRPSGSR
jgi:integrase/recombinase XerD